MEKSQGSILITGATGFIGRQFDTTPSCALFRVQIASIYLGTCFQNVTEFHFSS